MKVLSLSVNEDVNNSFVEKLLTDYLRFQVVTTTVRSTQLNEGDVGINVQYASQQGSAHLAKYIITESGEGEQHAPGWQSHCCRKQIRP